MTNKLNLLYYTEDYPKLVELVARQCYQSFAKVNDNSHIMLRGIMEKGHLSVASVGNIVFSLSNLNDEHMYCLLKMKEINNYIRWTTPVSLKVSNTNGTIISLNILSLMEYKHAIENGAENILLEKILEEAVLVPNINWFLNKEVVLPPKDNNYIKMQTASLYNPVILTEDYTKLKEIGLSDEQLNMHATVTVSFVTDRSSGLQFWRHSDMTGGTELSQRYVDRGQATFRPLQGFTEEQSEQVREDVRLRLEQNYANVRQEYVYLFEKLKGAGIKGARSKEIARSILPNAITTEVIQCRPLRQWKHLFALRDTVHAQKEIATDVQSMKKAFRRANINIG